MILQTFHIALVIILGAQQLYYLECSIIARLLLLSLKKIKGLLSAPKLEHWVGVEPTNVGFADQPSTDGDPTHMVLPMGLEPTLYAF